MDKLIREKRKLILDSKRITPNIIRELAKVIDEVTSTLKQENEDIMTLYSVDAIDNSSYESESILIFNEDGLLDTKAINKITMSLISFKKSNKIEIQILHSEKNLESESYIWVSGSDSVWVNGIFQKMENVLNVSESQPNHNGKFLFGIFLLLIGVNAFYFRFLNKFSIKASNEMVALLMVVGPPAASLFFMGYMQDYLNSTFPKVELQTGPYHLQFASIKRKNIYWIISAIIIPLVLSFIYELISIF